MWNCINITYISKNMKLINLSTQYILFITVILLFHAISPCSSTISDKRLCCDPDCNEQISFARTTTPYNAIDTDILSFPHGVEAKIFSKSAGSRPDLWGVEIGGKRGYAPSRLLQEKRIICADPKHEVPTKFESRKSHQSSNESSEKTEKEDKTNASNIGSNLIENNDTALPVNIDQVSPSFEVIDGTTIYSSPQDLPQQEENSYATKIIENRPSPDEQPTLSVHPNILASEEVLDVVPVEKTGILSSKHNEKKSEPSPSGNIDGEEIISSDSDNSGTKSDESLIAASTKEETKTTSENKEDNFNESLTSEDKQVVNIEKIDVDVKKNPDVQKNDENREEVKENSDEVENESRETEKTVGNDEDEDKKLADVSENDESDVEASQIQTVTNTIANAFDKVTSIFSSSTGNKDNIEEKSDEKIEDAKKVAESKDSDEVQIRSEEPLKNIEKDLSVDQDVNEEDLKLEVPRSGIDEVEPNENFAEVENSIDQLTELSSSEIVIENEKSISLSSSEDNPNQTENKLNHKKEDIKDEIKLSSSESSEPLEKIETSAENDVKTDQNSTENIKEKFEPAPKVAEPHEKMVDKASEMPIDTVERIPKTEIHQEKSLEDKKPPTVPKPNLRKISNILRPTEIPTAAQVPSSAVQDDKPRNEIIEEQSSTTETSVQINLENEEEKIEETVSSVVSTTETTIADKTVNIDSIQEDNVANQDVNVGKDDVSNNIEIDSQDDAKIETIESKNDEDNTTQHGQPGINERDELSGLNQKISAEQQISSFNEFPGSRNLLNVKNDPPSDNPELIDNNKSEISTTDNPIISEYTETSTKSSDTEEITDTTSKTTDSESQNVVDVDKNADTINDKIKFLSADLVIPTSSCYAHNNCDEFDSVENKISDDKESTFKNEGGVIHAMEQGQNYWETLSYVTLTAVTTLLFSLGYFYIENTRRDSQLIAKINKLEKELLISSKECTVLDETLKSTTTKLNSYEDETIGSNQILQSLKSDLDNANKTNVELENQVATLEKDLESATEAGLELERMLREILSAKNEDNPLAKTIEDLQNRLDTQQSANESLTSALQLKTQENKSLRKEHVDSKQKCEKLQLEVTRVTEELKSMRTAKQEREENLNKKLKLLEKQVTDITEERATVKKLLKSKEIEIKDLSELMKKSNIENVDFMKLSEVSLMKAEIEQLKEDKEELQDKLADIEGAHDLLEEHMKMVNKEMTSLTDQVKVSMKGKEAAETRLEVLTKFFEAKEAERQKEEDIWMQKQGEVSTTVEKMQILQSEILNYKQQIETLKREVLDQEKEYKAQIASLEAKAHDQWVRARQSERRLEESKQESGQLRNRLTLIEKNLSDNESEAKTHRLESNGETATSPQLFIGAETSSSPLMFTSSSNLPPPYLYGPPLPPFLTSHLPTLPGYDVGQRPPPLGGRLSSPPPMPINAPGPLPPPPPLHTSSNSRYDHHSGSSPSPPVSPPILPPHHGPPPPPHGHFRSNHAPPPQPIPPFPNDRIPPVPLPGMLPPPHLPPSTWGEDKLSSRNNGSFHPFQREQHPRDYKDLPEDSVDRPRRSGKL